MILGIDDVDAADVRAVFLGDGGDLLGLAEQGDIREALVPDDGGGLDGSLLLAPSGSRMCCLLALALALMPSINDDMSF